MRRLGYQRGLQLQPSRAPNRELFDALGPRHHADGSLPLTRFELDATLPLPAMPMSPAPAASSMAPMPHAPPTASPLASLSADVAAALSDAREEAKVTLQKAGQRRQTALAKLQAENEAFERQQSESLQRVAKKDARVQRLERIRSRLLWRRRLGPIRCPPTPMAVPR